MLVMIIMVPLELIVLGPIGSYLGTYIALGIDWFYNAGGILSAALLGGTRSLITMLGMHYALAPLQIQQIAETGISTLLVSALTANFSQAGAAFGAGLALKDKKEKAIAFSTSFSALLGITEPAMYGVNLKYKRPFAIAMVSSAIAAAFLSLFHTGAMVYAPPGLFTLITYKADNFAFVIIGVLVAFGLATVLTYLFGIKKADSPKLEENQEAEENIVKTIPKGSTQDLLTPLVGKSIPLSQVPDPIFSSGAMGNGLGIIPKEGKVFAPFDGEITLVFDTKHALGIKSDDLGIEILIHVGLNTVKEAGKDFLAHVKQGDKVKAGDLLLEFDLEALGDKYNLTTPIVITNSADFSEIDFVENADLEQGSLVSTVQK